MEKGLFDGSPIRKAFATDKALEDGGVWRDHESGICTKIRRSSRVEHKRALRKFYKPFAHLNNVDPKDEMKVKMKAAAAELIADWGIRNRDGTIGKLVDGEGMEIRPTEANIYEAFETMNDYFQWVTEEADTFEYYRVGAVEDAGKNSSPSSAGNVSGDSLEQPPSLTGAPQEESESLPLSSVRG